MAEGGNLLSPRRTEQGDGDADYGPRLSGASSDCDQQVARVNILHFAGIEYPGVQITLDTTKPPVKNSAHVYEHAFLKAPRCAAGFFSERSS